MTTKGLRLARWSLPLLAGLCLLGGPVQAEKADKGGKADKADKKPLILRIKLPADAELYIDDGKTQQTGPDRTFESPPVTVGKTYNYKIKAVWKQDGKEVVRETKFAVKTDQVNELDLLALPKPSLKVQVPAAVDVEAGGKATIHVKITAEHVKGPVSIDLEGAPPGSKHSGGTLVPGKTEGTLELHLRRDTKAGTSELLVKAWSDEAKADAKVKLNVKAAPPPPAHLKLDVPASVAVEAGARKPLPVKITREHFKGSVKVSFTGLPGNINLPELTIPEDKSEATVELAPPPDAKAGASEVTVKAEGGGAKAESKLKLDIKPNKDVKPADKDKDKDKPKDKDKDGKDKDKDKAAKDKDKPKDK